MKGTGQSWGLGDAHRTRLSTIRPEVKVNRGVHDGSQEQNRPGTGEGSECAGEEDQWNIRSKGMKYYQTRLV